jgi:hypothetical protein
MKTIRPSFKELNNKIRQTTCAVIERKVFILDYEVVLADSFALEFEIAEIHEVLSEVLQGISPEDYAGTHPPQRSYKKKYLTLICMPFISGVGALAAVFT